MKTKGDGWVGGRKAYQDLSAVKKQAELFDIQAVKSRCPCSNLPPTQTHFEGDCLPAILFYTKLEIVFTIAAPAFDILFIGCVLNTKIA